MPPRPQQSRYSGGGGWKSVLVGMILIVAVMMLSGIIISSVLLSRESTSSPPFPNMGSMGRDNIELFKASTALLSEKMRSWSAAANNAMHAGASGSLETYHSSRESMPDFRKQFWTPIHISRPSSEDPTITLCKLDFKMYSSAPHATPMFKDFEAKSGCSGLSTKTSKLSTLMSDLKTQLETPGNELRVIPPTGFVFHEGRVGSTLVANLLGSNPYAMVFSESDPPVEVLTHCSGCTRERQVQLFRDVVTLMGVSPIHTHMFFKMQSISTTVMEIALEAFPDAPWAFVYRRPVQTMMSQVDPFKGANGPCLRSKRNRPREITDVLGALEDADSAKSSDVAWCAAHLNMLCQFGIRAYEKYGKRTTVNADAAPRSKQRGMLINYESLPGVVPRALLPMFGIRQVSAGWIEGMLATSRQYSKGRRGQSGVFSGDSSSKDSRATDEIKHYAHAILDPTFERLTTYSKEALEEIMDPEEFDAIESHTHNEGAVQGDSSQIGNDFIDWAALSVIQPPQVVRKMGSSDSAAAESVYQNSNLRSVVEPESEGKREELLQAPPAGYKHSTDIGKSIAYSPDNPFANTHYSKPIKEVYCPDHPPLGYPEAFSMLGIIENWNPDNTDIPPMHYDSLCHFDYQTEYQKALNYREAEVPFVVYNYPEVDKVVREWNSVDYLQNLLGMKSFRTETSKTNHFMYFRGGTPNTKNPDGSQWEPPTAIVNKKFEDWLQVAVSGQNQSLSKKHEYFRVSSDMGNPWLYAQLPFFKPKKSLFIVEPHQQRGIHCRFGMKSVIAEAHFDSSRNSVAMIGGLRRWILTHPGQCKNMHMYPRPHPSGRHSSVDWSDPDVEKYPNFKKVVGNEVILQPGDMLYVPTFWIHYIVSLNVNFQCNTRSGMTHGYDEDIIQCGF